jgi:putative transposase
VKRSLVVEADGGPLGITTAGANMHDTTLRAQTLAAIVVERPEPTAEAPQHPCLDKGDDHPTGHQAAAAYHDRPHVRRTGEEKFDERRQKRYPARRWVVERTLAWLSKCRALLVRYGKRARHSPGLLQLACALLWLRRRARLIRDGDSF